MEHLSIPAKKQDHLFYIAVIFSVASVLCAAIFKSPYFFALPVAAIFFWFAFFDFKKIYFLLLLVLPFTNEFTLPGGLGMDLPGEPLVILLMFVFLFYLLREKYDPEFLKSSIILMLAAHLIWIFITIFFSQKIFISVKWFFAKTWFIATFVFVTGLIIKNQKQFRSLFWWLIIPSSISIIVVLIRHAMLGFDFDTINKASSIFFRNHVNYAAYVSLLMPFIWLAGTWYKSGTIGKHLVSVLKILFLVATYFAFARGAWLALIAAVVFYYALKHRFLKLLAIGGFAFFILLAAHLTTEKQYLQYAPEYEKTIYHGNILDHLKATIKNQDISTAERFYRWVGGVRMIPEHPLTGFGPGTFYHFYKTYTVTSFQTYVSDNPEKSTVHNYFLLMFIEQGLPGFLIFVALSFFIFYEGSKIYHRSISERDKIFVAAILCSLVVIYVQLMLSDLVEAFHVGSFFFINIALLVNQGIRAKKNYNIEIS